MNIILQLKLVKYTNEAKKKKKDLHDLFKQKDPLLN